MRQRPFGSTDLVVSEVGVGCSRIGGLGSSRKDELAMLAAAVDAGITFFDTSDLYSQGRSEVLLGQALRHRRDEVVIATKGGYLVPAERRLLARVKPLVGPLVRQIRARRPAATGSGPAGPSGQDFSPHHLAAAAEASLRRLGVDTIDLYQLHSPPRAVIEAGAYVEVLEMLREQGKIRHWGIAADAADDVTGFDRNRGVASLQVPFSLAYQEAADHLLPEAAERGLGVIARSCYAAGLLRPDPAVTELQQLTPDWERIMRVRAAAERLGRPVLQAALLFDLGAPGVAVTIVGMRTPAHLADNLRHLEAPPLGEDELEVLRLAGRP